MYEIDFKAIGRRISNERQKQKLTQQTLAEMLEVSISYLGHIERGTRSLTIQTLAKIANIFNLNIEYLISGEYSYKPHMLPAEIYDALDKMSSNQRKVFLSVTKMLAAAPDKWQV
jgi:transcriptional regulator with XRE-family HTH domain